MTVTGKRLQADAAMQATVADCGMNIGTALDIFSIRPNPVGPDDIKVYFTVPEDATNPFFEIFTVTGARVTRVAIENSDIEQGFIRINANPLSAGIYLLTLRNDKDSVTRKLVVVI